MRRWHVALATRLIYLYHISDHLSLSERAYREIRRMIVRLELAPGAVLRDEDLQRALGLGRTPIREALQRLVRDQFVTVLPRRGMFVSTVDIGDLTLLYETRAMLEPYAMRLACARGTDADWDEMASVLDGAGGADHPGADDPDAVLEIDRRCRELVWRAAGNRFLTDTLDMLYTQSDRLWHLYLGDVADARRTIDEHRDILDALRDRDADRAADLIAAHMRRFDDEIRTAVRRRLDSPASTLSA